MNYLSQYFITENNLSKKSIENSSNITVLRGSMKQSIFNEYSSNINAYIEKNKINMIDFNKFNILKKLMDSYNKNIVQTFNPKIFLNLFILYIKVLQNNINGLISFNKIYNSMNFSNKSINMSFINPLNNEYLELFDIDIKTNMITANNNYLVDILTQGNVINMSLPSIGVIYNKYSNDNILSYVNFINNLCKNTSNDVIKLIPFKSLNLGETLTELLFSLKTEINNTPLKNVFINMINNISVDLIDIFTYKINDTNNNRNRKLKPEYIIPYKKNIKKNGNDVIQIEENDINKYKNLKDIIDNNNNIAIYVFKNVFKNNVTNDININILNKPNYKNVLACYMFYVINLTCDILNAYVDKIDNIFQKIIESKNNKFKDLNIKDLFEYTTLLKKSILKFRIVLLNNFYNLFLPSSILEGNYGMKMNKFGMYIPESDLFGNSIQIINNYPFRYTENANKSFSVTTDLNLLKNFILNINNNVDIYNTNLTLEFGGNINNFTVMKTTMLSLSTYYIKMKIFNKFTLYLLDLLINNWKTNAKVPVESVADIINLDKLDKTKTNIFENTVLLKYEENIKNCVTYIINTIKIREKIKQKGITNISNIPNNTNLTTEKYYNELQLLEILNLIMYNFYNMKCLIIIKLINKYTSKNSLLDKINGIKMKYQSMLNVKE